MSILQHLHTYERSRANKKIYRCVDPDCTHYTSRALLIGKRSCCFSCGTPFILNHQQLRNWRPRCPLCTKSPKAEQRRKSLNVLEGIFSGEE